MSRFALLDIFLAFWLLCAAHCLVADRDWARLKLARSLETSPPARPVGVRSGARPALETLAGRRRGVLRARLRDEVERRVRHGRAVGADVGMGQRDAARGRRPLVRGQVAHRRPAPGLLLVLRGGVGRLRRQLDGLPHPRSEVRGRVRPAPRPTIAGWGSVNDFGGHPHGPIEGALHDLDILWNYHQAVYAFHTGTYIKEATHPFQSNPGGWLLINRPLGIDAVSGGPSAGRRVSGRRGLRPAGARDRDAGPVVGRRARPDRRAGVLGVAQGLAVRAAHRRRAHGVAAVVPVRPATDLLLLRGRDHPVHRDRGDAGARQDHRPRRRQPTTDGWSACSSPVPSCSWSPRTSPTSTPSSATGCSATRSGTSGCGSPTGSDPRPRACLSPVPRGSRYDVSDIARRGQTDANASITMTSDCLVWVGQALSVS